MGKLDNPFLIEIVLPLLQKLCRDCGSASSRVIGELLGGARRTAYNWLNALREAGLAQLCGKRWIAVQVTDRPEEGAVLI